MAAPSCRSVRQARAYETHLSDLTLASRALLLLQAGPHSARAIAVAPTHEAVSIPNAQFRVLLLRRLRLPLPLAPRTRSCRGRLGSCRGRLDAFGDHRAACATSGVLAARAGPLERAVARVCREAGARVAPTSRTAALASRTSCSSRHHGVPYISTSRHAMPSAHLRILRFRLSLPSSLPCVPRICSCHGRLGPAR